MSKCLGLLCVCVLQGNVRFLKLLLSRRANWLQKDLEEMTPLHLATRHPSPKALALLLKHIGPGEVDTQDKNKVLQNRYTQMSCQSCLFVFSTVHSLSSVRNQPVWASDQ